MLGERMTWGQVRVSGFMSSSPPQLEFRVVDERWLRRGACGDETVAGTDWLSTDWLSTDWLIGKA
ncbi:hypothetical protein Pla52o_16240 [Novipirellula galeiformis]|uniref:Uncharacterized protein n=1 Tax=Novipirellula galeiformis TaxID=2528004 RepID=A0A5C6CMM6_9BACT|nr:hypothetical protein Pla52o_16240 [Novipirellula galeiformis]